MDKVYREGDYEIVVFDDDEEDDGED